MAKVLVVDNEAGMIKSISRFLSIDNHELSTAANAKEALKQIEKKSFDVIVTDIIMPESTSIDLLNSIHKTNPEIKIIVITGDPTIDTASQSVRSRAFGYLSKPINKEAICDIVKKAVTEKTRESRAKNYRSKLEEMVQERTKVLNETNIQLNKEIEARKKAEESILSRINKLTMPDFDIADIEFENLFDINEIQKIQDAFANATGVASLIIKPDGTHITKPSNFSNLCKNIIRCTEKGLSNCLLSSKLSGKMNTNTPTIHPCHSGGLWDSSASISVGKTHLANWLIGQIRDESQNEGKMLNYCHKIGANESDFKKALAEVPIMRKEQFKQISNILFLFANNLSELAYKNAVQASNILKREQAEEEKHALEGQLHHMQKMDSIDRLAGGIAHDFNNLLTGIIANVTFAKMDIDNADLVTNSLNEIEKISNRAANLTKQLLTFSRRQTLEPMTINLNDVIIDIKNMLERIIGKDIHLKTSLSPENLYTKVDPGQFEQVLVNLCVNARDAMPAGGEILIETSSINFDAEFCESHLQFEQIDYVKLSVSDTGTGISEEIIDKIFEPFFTTKPKGKGTGLGMATVFGIIKQSNGAIEITSEVGQGTTIKVFLPIDHSK